jgi:tousled-like kinase
MEYCGGTDLDTYLKNHKTLKESDAKLIIKQVISGLRALHELGIIHYDLKPANILFASELSSCMEVKITDFGLSKMVAAEGNSASSEIELTSVGTGTFWYLPPECFSGRKRITNKVDIWAVGVIFYQLLVGRKPFANDESQQSIWENNSITKAVQKGVEWPQDLKVSPGCKQFIKDCLTALPDSRPDIGQLSSHPYLMGERKRPRALMEVVSGPGTATGGSQVFEAGLAPPVAPPLRHREGGPM